MCEFRLAVDGRPRLYLTVQTWGHLAGRCAQHLRAGRHVARHRSLLCHEQWITRAGERADRWYARAIDVTFLDRPSDVDDDTVDLATPGRRHDERQRVRVPSRRRLPHRDARPRPAARRLRRRAMALGRHASGPTSTPADGWDALEWVPGERGWELPVTTADRRRRRVRRRMARHTHGDGRVRSLVGLDRSAVSHPRARRHRAVPTIRATPTVAARSVVDELRLSQLAAPDIVDAVAATLGDTRYMD